MSAAERKSARELDEQNNSRLVLPDDEQIRIPKLWAVEFYPPRHAENFLERFRRLGWEGRRGMFEPPSVSEWLADARRQGHGWRQVPRYGPGHRDVGTLDGVRLPAGVREAKGYLGVVSPSLAAFVVCFAYEPDDSAAVEKALRRPRWTRSILTRTGWQHYGPPGQKFADILAMREKRGQAASAWFRKHVPGVFTSGRFSGRLPTCELLTFAKATPFPVSEEIDPATTEYLQALTVFFRGPMVWSMADRPSVKLRLPRGLAFEGPISHYVLTAKQPDWPVETDEMVSRIVAWLGIPHLLQGFGDTTLNVRHSVASSPVAGPRSAIQALRRSQCSELAPVLDELASWPNGRARDLDKLRRGEPEKSASPVAEAFVELVRAEAVKRRDEYRDAFAEMSNLCSLLLQRRVELLTWVLIAIAIAVAVWEGVSAFLPSGPRG